MAQKAEWVYYQTMGLSRRRLLYLTAGAAAVPAVSRLTYADTYPSRPVHIVCGFAQGGPQDIFARLAAQVLSQQLGQQFVVDNTLGAGGNSATEAVVNAAPDGYTLLLVGPPNAINATLYDHLKFNFIRDIAPVAGIARTPNVMVVNPSFPAKTVPEFIDYAKANPGKIKLGSGGNGTIPHVAGELFQMMTGVSLVHVPYRGEILAVPDLLAGKIQVIFGSMAWAIAYIKAGKLRPLAVTTVLRSELLPDLPTIGAFVPGYEASAWYGLGAPKATPAGIIETLNTAVSDGLIAPDVRAQLAGMGGRVLLIRPVEFGNLIAEETEKWGKVIQTADIKAD
jgi:tripartite-type tricarboxylate transporter receptor subunit TctC